MTGAWFANLKYTRSCDWWVKMQYERDVAYNGPMGGVIVHWACTAHTILSDDWLSLLTRLLGHWTSASAALSAAATVSAGAASGNDSSHHSASSWLKFTLGFNCSFHAEKNELNYCHWKAGERQYYVKLLALYCSFHALIREHCGPVFNSL